MINRAILQVLGEGGSDGVELIDSFSADSFVDRSPAPLQFVELLSRDVQQSNKNT
jgi:hypothetical protein